MKAIASIVLTFLLGAMFMSLFHMSASMDMSGGMSDCPFMSHEAVLCPMNIADHIAAWKSAFVVTVSTSALLLTVVGTAVFVATFGLGLLGPRFKPIPILYRQLRERVYSFSYRRFQDLFSQGILHPKVY